MLFRGFFDNDFELTLQLVGTSVVHYVPNLRPVNVYVVEPRELYVSKNANLLFKVN